MMRGNEIGLTAETNVQLVQACAKVLAGRELWITGVMRLYDVVKNEAGKLTHNTLEEFSKWVADNMTAIRKANRQLQ